MAETNVDLLAFLAELEEEVARKSLLIAEIKRRLGRNPNDVVVQGITITGSGETLRDTPPGQVRSDEFFRMSMPDAIRKFLALSRKPQYPKAIAEGLKTGGLLTNAKDFYANVTTAIKRLEAADAVVSTPNGWGLTEWYPSRPKGAEAPKSPKKRRRRARRTSKQTDTSASKFAHRLEGKRTYMEFFAKHRQAGLGQAEIVKLWKEHKAAQNSA